MVELNDTRYRALVALNNAGVQLLQHQRSIDGLHTLTDALALMKCLFQDTEVSSALQLEDINMKLQAAWTCTSQIHANEIVPHEMKIMTVANQDSPLDVLKLLKQNPESVSCVRIDLIEGAIDCYDAEHCSVDASIILYNIGVAHLFTSTRLPTHTTSVNHHAAIRLFKLWQNAIGVNLVGLTESTVPSDLLLISMLSATCLDHFSTNSISDQNCRMNLQFLDWVLTTIIAHERMFATVSPSASAAA
jgi:hypothetical protein